MSVLAIKAGKKILPRGKICLFCKRPTSQGDMVLSELFKRLFSKLSGRNPVALDLTTVQGPESPAKIPEGCRVYAVGDIHGRLDLLKKLFESIDADSRTLSPGERKILILLGDYIDRGDQSREVIDFLLLHPLAGFESIFIQGNHEAEMASFLARPQPDHGWLAHGGLATIASYRVRVANRVSAEEKMIDVRDGLLQAIPAEHKIFFSGLRHCHEVGDYFFVHAGVRPGVPLKRQNPVDFLWIREPFLNAYQYHGRVIVHGHTVTERPVTLPNRIGIDTGAYYSAKLTCLVLEGETKRFLST
ncbi:MAG: serine/threonine protein phosphatase [Magnetococcus sp. THC-1_WYH]